jgi:hypothetical protein
MAGIPAPCEEAGRLLADVSIDIAIKLIDIIEKSGDLSVAQAALALDPRLVGVNVVAACEATLAVIATERHGSVHVHEHLRAVGPSDEAAVASAGQVDPRWVRVTAALEAMLPATEYATWIAPLKLIHAEDALAVITTPNVFVRSEVQGRYREAIQKTLEQVWGQPVQIEVVIDMALAA